MDETSPQFLLPPADAGAAGNNNRSSSCPKKLTAKEWVGELKDEWERARNFKKNVKSIQWKRCIYGLPGFMRSAYWTRPRIVSLGPYHHGNPQLRYMEWLKRRMLGYYLAKIGRDLEEVMAAMRREVVDMMYAYDGLVQPWTNADEFVRLMVVDGCFLLELHFLMFGMEDDEDLRQCYEEMRPVSSTINTDISLLENQVPIRALELMAELGGNKVPTTNVAQLLLRNEVPDDVIDDLASEAILHKLHAVWISRLVGNNFLFKSTSQREVDPPTVTELVEAGIKIQKSDSMSISFEKGVLKLPYIKFFNDIGWQFCNLMAFEKMNNLDPEFFSFLEFMDALIDSAKDVEYLRQRGVLGGAISSDQGVANFFNTITRGIYAPERKWRTTGNDVAMSLANYCRKWQNKWPASFRHLYLTNPWNFISLLGAILLLALTIVSTVYSMLQYYNS